MSTLVKELYCQKGKTTGQTENGCLILPDELTGSVTKRETNYFPYDPFLSRKNLSTAFGALVLLWSFAWLYIGTTWSPLGKISKARHVVLNCDIVPSDASLNPAFLPYLSHIAPQPLATSWLQASIYNPSSSASHTFKWIPFKCPNTQGSGCGTAEEELACLAILNRRLLEEKEWGLLYFPSNFTTTILSYVYSSGISPHGQQVEMQYRYAMGRDFGATRFFGGVLLEGLMPSINSNFFAALAPITSLVPTDPLLLARGANVLRYDLAPIRFFGQHFATLMFCVVYWLGSSFVVGVFYQFKMPSEAAYLDVNVTEKPPKSRLMKEIFVKGLLAVSFMFLLSVLLICVLWSLGKGSLQWHKNAGYAIAFGWYLSWSFVALNAVLLHAMGVERFSSMTAFLLVLQLTSGNAIFHNVLSSPFFKIGRIFPFYYGTRGFRTIFFGVMGNKMWVNWLVFTGWNLAMAPLGVWFVTHKTVKNSIVLHMRHAGLTNGGQEPRGVDEPSIEADSATDASKPPTSMQHRAFQGLIGDIPGIVL